MELHEIDNLYDLKIYLDSDEFIEMINRKLGEEIKRNIH